MPIRTRITGIAERAELLRKAKGRHPLLKIGSKHLAVWQTICQDGNPHGGITAAKLRGMLGDLFHPQVLKDLIDHRLVAKRGKQHNNAFKYVGDEKGRGSYVQEVTVEVELLEDADGKFVTRTTLVARSGSHGRIVRCLGRRRIHFTVPLPNEPGVENIVGLVNVDNDDGFNTGAGTTGRVQVIHGQADYSEGAGLLEGNYAIIEE